MRALMGVRMIARQVTLAGLLLALVGLLPQAWAQELAWRLGPGPGTTVELPVVATVQGPPTQQGVPTLVVFTLLDGSEMAYEFAALAAAWQRRHPGVQILLVDTRSDPDTVRTWVRREQLTTPVVADADNAFAEAFDTNRLPIVYLLDGQGVIQDKVVGGDLARFIELDQLLSWAAAGKWEQVAAQRTEWLRVGEVPARRLADVPLGQGRPTVVYRTHPLCPPCQRVAEGLQAELNRWAASYPDVDVVILEADVDQDRALQATTALLAEYIELYGREAVPGDLLLAVERGRFPDQAAVALPREGWAPNVTLITYMPGDANDTARWWGQVTTPGLMIFDAEGVYQGPDPLWLGPFEAPALMDAIVALID